MKPRLLITGYPGWLTSRFLETLNEYPFSGFSSIRCLVHPAQRIPALPQGTWSYVPGDLLDSVSLREAVKECDIILHAAGIIHVKHMNDFYRINRDGTRDLLEAAASAGISKMIYISSNAAQGFCKGRGNELDETAPCRPVSHYGKSKRQGEEVVLEYQRTGKIQTVILRPAMFYGPPVPWRHLDVYKRILRGRFPVFGTGDYLRSVTYIDNLVQAIHLAIQKPEANGKIYTIIDRETPTLKEVIFAMAVALGTKVKIQHFPKWMAQAAGFLDKILETLGIYWMLPHIVGEAHKHIAYRITRAEKDLGYNPKINYQEGYRKAIDWCFEKGLLKRPDKKLQRAVFFDRDGVLVKEMARDGKPYTPLSPEEMEIHPQARGLIKTLRDREFFVFVVTNQPDIARKKLSSKNLENMHHRLWTEIGKKNLNGIYVCPHDSADGCACRKPKPGMLYRAAAEWGLDLRQSFFIGDHARDVGAGKAAGCKTILLRKSYNQGVETDETADDLEDAVRRILAAAASPSHEQRGAL